MTYYYMRDGFVSLFEYIGLPIMLAIAWWFGKQYDKAKFYSEKDNLTGIYNRRFVEAFFPKIKAMSERNSQNIAVFLIDINNFKAINDNFGHRSGDELLKVLSYQLEISVRNTDIVARWGGDEFIIISPNIKESENVDEIIRRIHDNLKIISDTYLEVSVSIGSAIYPNEGSTLDDLLKISDKKMYNMKIQTKAE